MVKAQKKKNKMKRSDKPFKMKSSPFKIFGAIATILAKLGVTAAGGKAITAAMVKKASTSLAGKAATSVASNLAMNALTRKNKTETQNNGAGNFANMKFGTGSSFTMKRNIKK
jgi:stage V sporulation protein SpoVS